MELIAESVMDITSVIINEDSSMICFEVLWVNMGAYTRIIPTYRMAYRKMQENFMERQEL